MKNKKVSGQVQKKQKNVTKKPKEPSISHKYTKFNANILDEHPHLKKYIKENTDSCKFTCLGCKKNNFPEAVGYYDHLIAHLETGKHKLAVEDDPKEIEEAILAIQGFRKRKKKVMKVDKAILDDERVDFTLFLLKHELPFSLSSPQQNL